MTQRLSSVLSSLDLPLPELRAAELDGEVFAIDGCWSPIDEPETASQRALALAVRLPDRVIIEQRSAAWVWGVLDAPPRPHDLATAIGARVRTGPDFPAAREVVIDDDEVVVMAGIRVTTPLRTIIDLARFASCFDEPLAERLLVFGRLSLAECLAALERRRNLPGKRLALERLTRLQAASTVLTAPAAGASVVESARVDAIHVVDGIDATHGVEQPIEMRRVTHLEHEAA